MSKRQRTSGKAGASAGSGGAGEIVFFPDRVELELVGIIGSVDGLPDLEAPGSVFLDDEDLIALIERLLEEVCAASSCGSHEFAGAVSLKDRPIH